MVILPKTLLLFSTSTLSVQALLALIKWWATNVLSNARLWLCFCCQRICKCTGSNVLMSFLNCAMQRWPVSCLWCVCCSCSSDFSCNWILAKVYLLLYSRLEKKIFSPDCSSGVETNFWECCLFLQNGVKSSAVQFCLTSFLQNLNCFKMTESGQSFFTAKSPVSFPITI